MRNVFGIIVLAFFADCGTGFSVGSIGRLQGQTVRRTSVEDTALGYRMDDIVHCASGGICSLEQMGDMIHELEEIDLVCDVDNASLEECGEDEEVLREMLKNALGLRMQLLELEQRIDETKNSIQSKGATLPWTGKDHSFDHYVDYKRLAQYESH